MLYFHVTQNAEKYLKPLSKSGVYKEMKEDIRLLQICAHEAMFTKATRLFLEKWRKNADSLITEFINYFEEQWIRKLPHWYEGAAPGFPSTNNGVEATNAILKRECTVRLRLPVGQFLHNITDLLESWSRRRDPASVNCTAYSNTPAISLPTWTAAYQWASGDHDVLERKTSDGAFLFVSSAKFKKSISGSLISKFEREENKWKTFDNFKEWRTRIWTIRMTDGVWTCTCPPFMKEGVCKHSLGLQIRRKLVEVPPAAKQIPIGQKRKRGRPALAKKALLR